MEFGVLGVPDEAEEAGVAGVQGVAGVAGAGGGERGVGTALNTSSFWKNTNRVAVKWSGLRTSVEDIFFFPWLGVS